MRALKVNALRVVQQAETPLFVFGVNGRQISHFASVEYAQRDRAGGLEGYQRERVTRHINEIYAYLKKSTSMLPNAIVVAFGRQVSFKKFERTHDSAWGTLGTLTIPLPESGQAKPGFIVDGQQRVAALSKLDPNRTFPVVVVGFQSASPEKQREQFVLVNKTKPLPKDLITELLPQIGGEVELTRAMQAQRFAGKVLNILRFDRHSPFCGRVKGLGSTGGNAKLSQNTLIAVIKRSITQGGVLSQFNSLEPEDDAAAKCASVVSVFFSGVRMVWPVAWEGSPRTSRLVHGTGIYAMGVLMDEVMENVISRYDLDRDRRKAVPYVKRRVFVLKKRCAWTEEDGRWPVLRRAWNDIENTQKDKAVLADYIVREWKKKSR
jgi:DGQHR domain-containing protein